MASQNQVDPTAAGSGGLEQPFEKMMGILLEGLNRVGEHVDRGPSYLLMAIGTVSFTATIALEILSRVGSIASERVSLGAAELAVMLISSIFLLIGGAGLRVWTHLLSERELERQTKLRMAAAEQVQNILLGTPAGDAGMVGNPGITRRPL